nr:LysR family transcriptional regulator [uncultured Maritalea sp.]
MQTFVAVAENSGITAAADKLGCSKAIVSRTLSLLEERLDVRLLNRTTRKVSSLPSSVSIAPPRVR